MKYSKIIGVLITVVVITMASTVFAGPNSKNWDKAGPWTVDTYLSAATTTGTSLVVFHDNPVSTYSCVITLASPTSGWVNIDLEGSLDNVSFFHLPVSGATISIGAATAGLLSTVTHTVVTDKPTLYTRMTYSNRSGAATAVTSKCLAY